MMTTEAVLENPSKFGFPTFAEFARNPDKFRSSLNDKMGRIDKSSDFYKNMVTKQTYKLNGYEAKTLEEIERIAKNEGIDLNGCKYCPQVLPEVGGKCRIVVEFKPKVKSTILDRFGNWFRR